MRFLRMAAVAVAGVLMTGCSSDDNMVSTSPQPADTDGTVTLTTTLSLGDGETRALTSDGTKTFAEGDQIAVIYKNTSGETKKAVGDISTGAGSSSATFTVTLEAPDNTAAIRYIYPAAMAKADIATDATIDDANTVDFTNLASQDGTLATLGSSYDLCVLDANSWTLGALPGGTLRNQLAILAVTVKDDKATATTEDDDPITASVTRLTVSDGTNKYTATGHDVDGPIYLAILPTTSADITVDIYTAAHHYVKALADKKTYVASNLYPLGWKINQKAEPLTMEALNAGTIVVNNPRGGMKYSKNGGDKTTMTETTTINVEAGDKVQFYGNGTSITQYFSTSSDYTKIAGGTAEVKVYGNIMSLVNETGFATATTLTSDNTFRWLFHGNDKLKDASRLLLPATELAAACYYSMFFSCSSLTAAPVVLPATTLAAGCYQSMFDGCSSLTAAPALPATTLANSCYYGMFSSCTSLTTAPALPATTLAAGCYYTMFWGCISLTTAPALPATTLAQYCYYGMFDGCKKLSAVTCLATKISATHCTSHWLDGVAASGTFTKAAGAGWPRNSNGIPSGWTVVDYVAP